MRTLVAVVLAAAAALGAEYTAWPAGGASTGWVSDSLYDPIIGNETHVYDKGTGDIVWGYDYHNLLDPKVNKTVNGWAKFSLDGLPPGAQVTRVIARHFIYGWGQTAGADMAMTTLSDDPVSAGASALWGLTTRGTVVGYQYYGLLWDSVMFNAAGRAHVQDGIERGWVALGYPYVGSSSVIDQFAYAYGYGGQDYRPRLAITYDLAGVEEPAGPRPAGNVPLVVEPNPVTGGRATLCYILPKAGPASVNVYDVTGRTVLIRGVVASRSGAVSLNVGELAAGTYLVRLEAEGFTGTQKLVVQH